MDSPHIHSFFMFLFPVFLAFVIGHLFDIGILAFVPPQNRRVNIACLFVFYLPSLTYLYDFSPFSFLLYSRPYLP